MIQIDTGKTKTLINERAEADTGQETPEASETGKIPEVKEKGSLMSVAEMGRILGLKKTDRYWLLHKGFFETRIFLGKTWVVRESFEKWYANQTHYRKVNGEAPGKKLLEHSYAARDMAGMLGLSEATVYEIIKREKLNTVVIDHTIRVPKETFDSWYAGQDRYRTEEDRNRDAEAESASITMPEMARLLGLNRRQVYTILNGRRYKDLFEIVVIAGRKRITRESFYRFLEVQERYRLYEEPAEEGKMQENAEKTAHEPAGGNAASSDATSDDPDTRQEPDDSRLFLGVSEAAGLIRVPEKLLYQWIREGTIPSRKVGRKVFLERAVLEEWQEKTSRQEILQKERSEQNLTE